MKVLGIVAEYNPFHNGHLYHLQSSRASAGADCVVAVMSGNFTQRGEPAVVDKWTRAEMAVLCGVDLVIELPCVYAMSSAEFFAFGAVKLLDSLGAVDAICFGSECGSLEKLDTIASILADEPEEYKNYLKDSLSKGESFPAARQAAISLYLKDKYGSDELSEILESSNNILGIEYLKALKRMNSRMVPVTLSRLGNSYNSAELSGELSSATSIRKILSQHSWPEAKQLLEAALPEQTLDVLEREFSLGRGPVLPSDYTMLLLSSLRKMTAEEISGLPYMEQGLENRFKLAAENSGTFDELLDAICTKRYTSTRIQRSLFSLLTGLRKESFDAFNRNGGPSYIRILAFNDTGRSFLSMIRDKASLPVITKAADFKYTDLPGVSAMLSLEAAASDQYVLAFKNPEARKVGSEFRRKIFYHNYVI